MTRTGLIAGTVALLLAALPAWALADVEPNDGILQPEGPIAGGTPMTGTLASDNDRDWYAFYVASQTQLDIALTTPAGSPCSTSAVLLNTNGYDVAGGTSAYANVNTTDHILYTTPVGVQRYFLVLDSNCAGGAYSFQLNPGAAIVSGPGSVPAVPTSEPNESAAQALGPLTGGLPYSGSVDTQNDQDWFFFYALGSTAFDLAFTSLDPCSTYASVYRDGVVDSLDSASPSSNQTDHVVYTPPAWGRYFVQVRSNCSSGARYQLRLDPASAIVLTPPPPPAAPIVRAPSSRCTRARNGVTRWRAAIRSTKAKRSQVVTRRARRRLTRKLQAQKRTLRRAKDRVTIYCT